MTKAPTQKEMFAEVIALAKANDRQDIVDFAEGRIAVLDKKAANKKATKTQEENVVLAEKVVAVLEMFEEPATASQILAKLKAEGYVDEMTSLPKITSRLHALKEEGKVVRTTDKKTALFSLA